MKKNFKKDYESLMIEMYEKMNEPHNERFLIEDGVMLPEIYFNREIRIAWMLKEAYDGDDGTGGDYSYFEKFEGEDLYESTFKAPHKSTWHPIIYICYGIHNEFLDWSKMDYIRDDHEMSKIVREIAFINAQKLPAKGVTVTNYSDLVESIEKFGDLIHRQIELLEPNVFIFGNTVSLYKEMLNLNEEFIINGSCSYLVKDGKLYIDAYHPAQKLHGGETYVNDIINTVRRWKNKDNKKPL